MVLARPRNFSTRVKMAMYMYEYQLQWYMRGYHIYKEEWEAVIGEELKCEREKNNAKDPYAVAVVRKNVIVGHLPRKISRISALFLNRQGKISWKVLGTGVTCLYRLEHWRCTSCKAPISPLYCWWLLEPPGSLRL